MERLLDGIRQFQREVFPSQKDLFEQLAGGQSPQALFITCADSRVVPDLITQSQPGDLFICRNAGNMVPPHGESHQGGVSATIEYAVVALNVEHVIVCGHTDCGAMKGILHPELLTEMPRVKNWLSHGELARTMVKENYPQLSKEEELLTLTRENVVAQLEHLHTYPCVAARLARGKIQLHAWVYNIKTGEVQAWDAHTGKYVPVGEYTPVRVNSRLHPVAV
ncbi:MAG TPA: carbonic anhydrase [Bryobacteraceae bacterium]|nr:carbonic anhydrase [Bryobacteraceae bacterium]